MSSQRLRAHAKQRNRPSSRKTSGRGLDWREAVVVAIALCAAVGVQAQEEPDPPDPQALVGAWRITSSSTVHPDGSVHPNASVPRSFVLFDGRNYSITWAAGTDSSPFFAERFKPTEAEMLARYPRLVFNAGTYVVEGSTIRVTPYAALVPEFVGGEGVFEFRMNGKNLELSWIDNTSVDGIRDPYVEMGVHWEFVLEPVTSP